MLKSLFGAQAVINVLILAWNSWFARDWPDEEPRRILILGAFPGTLVGFAASLNFQLGSASYETMRRPATRQLTA